MSYVQNVCIVYNIVLDSNSLQCYLSYHLVCPQKNVDVVFVLDGSLSVLAGNFERVKKWVSNITKQLNIDKGSVRVGVLQYAE